MFEFSVQLAHGAGEAEGEDTPIHAYRTSDAMSSSELGSHGYQTPWDTVSCQTALASPAGDIAHHTVHTTASAD